MSNPLPQSLPHSLSLSPFHEEEVLIQVDYVANWVRVETGGWIWVFQNKHKVEELAHISVLGELTVRNWNRSEDNFFPLVQRSELFQLLSGEKIHQKDDGGNWGESFVSNSLFLGSGHHPCHQHPVSQHEEINSKRQETTLSNIWSPLEFLKSRLGSYSLNFIFGAKSRMKGTLKLLRKLLGILGFLYLWITVEAQIKIPPET